MEILRDSQCSASLPNPNVGSDVKLSSQNSFLSCLYLNARSLTNKIALLQNYVNECKPSIIVVTETWAKSDIPDGFYTISGYKLIRADRLDKRGGGVIAYIIETINSSQIFLNSCSDFESLCFKLNFGGGICAGFFQHSKATP